MYPTLHPLILVIQVHQSSSRGSLSIRLGTLRWSSLPGQACSASHGRSGLAFPVSSLFSSSIPEAKRDFSFIGQREALCEHSLPGLASTPLNLMKRHYLSPFCGTPSIGCLSTTDPLQNPSIFPANFSHQYKQESTTQTATPSSPFPIFSLIFIPNSSQDLVVLSVCMAYPALPSPTPLQYGLSPKRCALHRLYFAIQHKVLISYLT